MKIVLRIGLAACLCVSLVGLALGQDYYGGYYSNQGYSPYSQSYGQGYQGYGQNTSSGYGYPYGYGAQANSRGYSSPNGAYDPYPGVPGYGRYEDTPYGAGTYGLPSVQNQYYQQPTLRTRLAPRMGPGSRPDVHESTQVISPSRSQSRPVPQPTVIPTSRNSDEDTLYNNEIYWDGSESEKGQSFSGASSRPSPSANQSQPPRSSAMINRSKPFSNPNDQSTVQRGRRNIVRQDSKLTSATPPPPAASGFKWGKAEVNASGQVVEKRQSFKWGVQGKPAMVGSEPGNNDSAPMSSSQVSSHGSSKEASNALDSGPKKFQWGRVQ
ncbi:MAG: hypothetical protein ACP5U1_17160 [Desulfomonilaceae bacterium]